ncbi:MAG TPA: sigma-54 dependent transcriptional regulator [Candidatus Brocadiales bacterium]|nr:sigma-54 dependent transcriptional regulator [Candidatus Brocadiales bacterium]
MMDKKLKVLFCDDEATYRKIMKEELSRMGHEVVCVESGEEALSTAKEQEFDVAICDMRMSGISGTETLKRLKALDPSIEVIMLTSQGSIESAVESMKLGAYDYLAKPCRMNELSALLQKASEKKLLSRENISLKRLVSNRRKPTPLLGQSRAMTPIFKLIDKVAEADSTVLIQGESGTGKELVAIAIHEKSKRAERPFVIVNCAALPETLLESELFGHTKGSFTGAHESRIGLFEVADGSTLFLDEIGELTMSTQAKLLRMLQSGEMRRVGENKVIHVDARIIAATNKNLQQEVKNGRFREDLFFRLNIITITLPPLRERKEDIGLLVGHFLDVFKTQTNAKKISPDAMNVLVNYNWPGNVRELENTIERLVILTDGDLIEAKDLPSDLQVSAPYQKQEVGAIHELPLQLSEVERRHILSVLTEKKGNKTLAAEALGISLKTLYNKLKAYNIPT